MRSTLHHRVDAQLCIRSTCILGFLFAAVGVVGLAKALGLTSGVVERRPEELVKTVVQKLSAKQITRVEIAYFDWGSSVYGGLSEDALLTQYHYKIILANPWWNVEGLQRALEDFKFRQSSFGALEFRISCAFYAGEEELLRLSFAENVPVVSINRALFQADRDLLSEVIAFLPHEAYERMYEAVLDQWLHSRSSWLQSADGNR